MTKKVFIVLICNFILISLVAVSGYTKSGLDLIPYDVKTVFAIYVNKSKLNQIKKNKKVANQLNKISNYGIKLRRVKVIFGGILDNQAIKHPNMVTVAVGRFNRRQVYAATKKKVGNKLSDARYGGVLYLRASEEENYSLAVLGSTFLILAKERHLKLAINLANGKGRSVRKNKGIANYFGTIREGNFFWMISILSDDIKDKYFVGNKLSGLKNIKVLSLTYRIQRVDTLKIHGICSNSNQATKTKDAMKEFVDQSFALISFITNDKTILTLSNNAKYTSKGNIATAQFKINRKQFNGFLKMVK